MQNYFPNLCSLAQQTPKLKILDISQNLIASITDIQSLYHLTHLEELNVLHNPLPCIDNRAVFLQHLFFFKLPPQQVCFGRCIIFFLQKHKKQVFIPSLKLPEKTITDDDIQSLPTTLRSPRDLFLLKRSQSARGAPKPENPSKPLSTPRVSNNRKPPVHFYKLDLKPFELSTIKLCTQDAVQVIANTRPCANRPPSCVFHKLHKVNGITISREEYLFAENEEIFDLCAESPRYQHIFPYAL